MKFTMNPKSVQTRGHPQRGQMFAAGAIDLTAQIRHGSPPPVLGLCGGIGRRDGFKIRFFHESAGSSPARGTIVSVHDIYI